MTPMGELEREKWDARYSAGAYSDRNHATQLVVEWLPRIALALSRDVARDTAFSRALDVACGAGRNACFLASQGFATDGVDISEVALLQAAQTAQAQGLAVRWLHWDLEERPLPFADVAYDLIVIVRYVNEALYAPLTQLLVPGGFLVVEQHLQTDADVVGPRSPAFRLTPGALRNCVEGLDVVHEFEGLVDDPDGRPAALAQIVAQRPAA
jgi:tellurite methyltransferase